MILMEETSQSLWELGVVNIPQNAITWPSSIQTTEISGLPISGGKVEIPKVKIKAPQKQEVIKQGNSQSSVNFHHIYLWVIYLFVPLAHLKPKIVWKKHHTWRGECVCVCLVFSHHTISNPTLIPELYYVYSAGTTLFSAWTPVSLASCSHL